MIIDINQFRKRKTTGDKVVDAAKQMKIASEQLALIANQIACIAKAGIVKWPIDEYDDQTKKEILLNGFRD